MGKFFALSTVKKLAIPPHFRIKQEQDCQKICFTFAVMVSCKQYAPPRGGFERSINRRGLDIRFCLVRLLAQTRLAFNLAR